MKLHDEIVIYAGGAGRKKMMDIAMDHGYNKVLSHGQDESVLKHSNGNCISVKDNGTWLHQDKVGETMEGQGLNRLKDKLREFNRYTK
jgi:hypothetical protein